MVILATKIYGEQEDRALQALRSILQDDVGALDVEYEVGIRHDGFPSVTIAGDDAVVARNVLAETWGEIPAELELGTEYTGVLEGWDDDGFILDVGAEVIIPPDELNLGPGDPEQIATRLGLVRRLPMRFVYDDPPTLADVERDRLFDWQRGSGRVNANGITRGQLRATVNRAGHADDIHTIERLGLLEQSIICSEDTDPPGLLASIGPYVSGDLACVVV